MSGDASSGTLRRCPEECPVASAPAKCLLRCVGAGQPGEAGESRFPRTAWCGHHAGRAALAAVRATNPRQRAAVGENAGASQSFVVRAFSACSVRLRPETAVASGDPRTCLALSTPNVINARMMRQFCMLFDLHAHWSMILTSLSRPRAVEGVKRGIEHRCARCGKPPAVPAGFLAHLDSQPACRRESRVRVRSGEPRSL